MKHLSNAQKTIKNFEHVREQKKLVAKIKRTSAKTKKKQVKKDSN